VLHRNMAGRHVEEDPPMANAFASERRLLSEDEREPIQRSHFPALEEITRPDLLDLARWLRDRRNRARDMMRAGRRAGRGKADARGAAPNPEDLRGLAAKKQVFAQALKRVNARLDTLLGEERRARNAARLRAALHRVQAEAPSHPGAGQHASAGAGRAKAHRKPRPTIHGARIGSVSQAGKAAQARRDARG
jgi:hypothetical protein